jgi:hypothetical protein
MPERVKRINLTENKNSNKSSKIGRILRGFLGFYVKIAKFDRQKFT